jgi:hypothetical protein
VAELVGMAADLHRMNDQRAAPTRLAIEQLVDRETLTR